MNAAAQVKLTRDPGLSMWTSSAQRQTPFCISTRRRAPSCRASRTIILYSEDRSESGGDLVTVPNLSAI